MKNLQKLTRNKLRGSTTRSGFTLIEIMVVLGIATFVAAIVIGGFSEMTAGSKRTSCQTNLTQIYQAARLYAADEGGSFPYYDATAPLNSGKANIGLWALYTFPQANSSQATGNPSDFDIIAPVDSAPVERYLRSAKSLHCPNDYNTDDPITGNHEGLRITDSTRASPIQIYNPNYLSYQYDGDKTSTYSPMRISTRTDPDWNRQLLFFDGSRQVRRIPDDKTVVTWCRFHRGGGRNDIDPVLFYDGTVQLIPREQQDPDGSGSTLTSWHRKPKAAS